MPIDIERFDRRPPDEPSTSDRILGFLLDNDARAFTRSEIADAIDSTPETVGTNLTRLKRRGLVRHREPYWALTDDRDRLREGETGDSGGGPANDREQDHVDPADASGAEGTARDDRPHRRACVAFLDRIRDGLGDEIEDLYLFGSVARGEATPDSDIDVLVVVADEADYRTVDDRLLDIAYDVQLEYHVPVEVHAMRASEFEARRERGDPFVRTVVREGRADV